MSLMRFRACGAVAAICGGCGSAVAQQTCLWAPYSGQLQFGDATGTMAYDPLHQRVLALLTWNPAGQLWSWNGTAWSMISASGPGARQGATAAYDSARGRLVVFGGWNNVHNAQTWEWDGQVWTLRTGSGPSPRWIAPLVYDTARSRTVMFGGSNAAPLSDTWEWDGQAWQLVATGGPGPLRGGMAYDSLRHRTVLVGSISGGPNPQMWEWDGVSWVHRATDPAAGPVEGGVIWMVFDPSRGRMIVSQGPASGVTLPGTWELETATAQWDFRVPGTFPYGPGAFDTARSRAVAQWISTTWEYDPAAPSAPVYIFEQPVGGTFPTGAPLTLHVGAGGTAPQYQWEFGGVPLVNDGRITGVDTATLRIDPGAATDTGYYRARVLNSCGERLSASVFVQVGQTGPPSQCYANCDGSTTPPFLNVLDFNCFLNHFVAGDSYANCDSPNFCNPVCLNVLDFNCFLNRFLAGCSAP
jgi:hypothetical protein